MVLSRKAGEGITVNQNISIEILHRRGQGAHRHTGSGDVRIYRKELRTRRST